MGHEGHNSRSSFYKYMGVEGTLSHDLPSESDSEHVRGSESRSHGTVAMVLDLSYDPLAVLRDFRKRLGLASFSLAFRAG